MRELEELKRRLRSLQKSPLYAKPAAAEEAIISAVDVLELLVVKVEKLEQERDQNGKNKSR